MGEAPRLWTWVHLILVEENTRCLQISRLSGLRSVEIASVSRKVLEAVMEHPGVKEITLEKALALHEADPQLLGRVVKKLEVVNMMKVADKRLTCMNYSQLKVFFATICEGNKLKCLNMDNRNMASVSPAKLAKVVSKLEEANLKDTQLTEAQVREIFQALSEGSKLHHLALSSNNLSSVAPQLLATGVTELRSLNLAYTQLTKPQTEALFSSLSQSQHLSHLTIGLNDLSSVKPQVLAQSVCRLDTVQMREACLTELQWNELLRLMGSGSSRLREADFSNNYSSLNSPGLSRYFCTYIFSYSCSTSIKSTSPELNQPC